MHNLIIKYINNLSIDDINTFAIKEGIQLTKTELNYLYIFIKNDYNLFLNNPNNFNIDDYKDRFSEENYPKIKEVFLKYFNKFKSYL